MFSAGRFNIFSPYLQQNLSESVVIDESGPSNQLPDKFIRKALWSPYYGSILGTTTETWFPHGLVKYHLDFYSVSQIVENQATPPSSTEIESSNGKGYSWPIFGSLEEAYPINDFLWYPAASTSDQGHFFLYAAKNQPIGMRNVEKLAGPCQAQFSTLDALSEIWHNPTCIALTSDATSLFAGGLGVILEWRLERPGAPLTIYKTSPSKKSKIGFSGLISCLEMSPHLPSALVTGTFHGDIAIFDTRSKLEKNMILFRNELLTKKEAVSHMKLSPNGYHLYCGYRSAEKSLVMYDLRFISGDVQKVAPVFQLDRPSYSQQRLYFDLSTLQEESEETVISGDSQGNVLFTDQSGSICRKASLHSGPITNASLHPFYPILLTTCGERPLRENFGVQSSLNLWHV